jgi:hypothetical protein
MPVAQAEQEVPQTVADMLAVCAKQTATNYSGDCSKPIAVELIAIENANAAYRQTHICPPRTPDESSEKALIASIVQWLMNHPELQTETAYQGAFDAAKALYPC